MNDLPLFSTTEERAFKQCRLAHHFEYDLQYRRQLTNRKLSTGIIVHEGLAAYYLGQSSQDVLRVIREDSDKRWDEILAASAEMDGYAEALATFQKDREMVEAMVLGYIDWVREEGVDADWETVAVEESHLIQVPEAQAVIPVRMDLIQRNRITGRLRVVDHKTARSIPNDLTPYYMAEQNANYQLACLAVYDERPTEMAYNFLRKVIPSNRTKPPYFHRESIPLTKEELRYRVEELRRVMADRFDPNRRIYAAPDNCCGTWKSDWRKPCMLVRQGYSPKEALEASPGFEPRDDVYERYNDLEDGSE